LLFPEIALLGQSLSRLWCRLSLSALHLHRPKTKEKE
jgi:hypothetical protein